MLQDKLCQTTGKIVTLKDITNISSSMQAKTTRNDLEYCVQKLTEKYGTCMLSHLSLYFLLFLCDISSGACVEVVTSESKIFQGLYFQDEEIKNVFAAYPEFVCIDATYKLIELCA